jgi:UDP-N-acetylglucosamine--N-acetylmuramyl-(pentapeptide) pyrophosphoryl-undecaprenol N-acetylglucosamine transferase
MKIVFSGGGTAGHIYPLIAVAREIRKINKAKDVEFYYIGPKDDFAASVLKDEGMGVRIILGGKVRRYFSLMNIVDVLFKIPIGFFQAFYELFIISPDLVFSKGGYGSVPVAIAAWTLRIPVFLHESDAMPGLANRICAKLAVEIFTAFPAEKISKLPINKMVSVGNPLRQNLLTGSPDEARRAFNLSGKRPVLLVLGGSQGALRINQVLTFTLSEILKEFDIIHQAGSKNFDSAKTDAEAMVSKELLVNYHLYPFLQEKELALAYKAATVILSRAGAGAIFEIAAAAKPSILVPLENSAQNHQLMNAYAFAESGGSIVLEENNFKPHFLFERLKHVISDEETERAMSRAAADFAKPDAARMIAEYICAYLFQ